jgi:hypothetical protein
MRRISWSALAVATLCAASSVPLAGQAKARAPGAAIHRVGVTFADTAPFVVHLDAAVGRTSFTMELVNPDSVDHAVSLRMTHEGLSASDTTPVSELRFAPDHVIVPALSRATVRLELASRQQHVSGAWSEYAVARDSNASERAAVRQIWLVAPAVQPLAQAWVVRAWRAVPMAGYTHFNDESEVVPLASMVPFERGQSLHHHYVMLRDSGGGSVGWVGWTDSSATTEEGRPGLALTFSDAGRIGTYVATLPLDSLYGAPPLSLTYTLTDAVWWPLVALFIGVYLAYRAQNYFTVKRPALSVGERLAAVGERWQAIQRELQQANVSRYDITASVNRRRAELTAQADALEQTAFLSATDQATAYTKESDAVQTFADGVEVWAQLPSRLAGAGALRAGMVSAANAYDSKNDLGRPSVLSVVDVTIVGGVREWDDGSTAVQDVKTLTTLMMSWRQMLGRLQRDRTLLENTARAAGSDGQKESAAAEAALIKAQARIWSAAAAADLSDKDLLASLSTVEEYVGTVAAQPTRSAAKEKGLVDLYHQDVGFHTLTDVAASPEPPKSSALLRAGRQRYDEWFLVLATIVAMLSGLKVLYFGHPFGRPEDYLTAGLWGFGTQLSLTSIADALKRLAGATSLGIKV